MNKTLTTLLWACLTAQLTGGQTCPYDSRQVILLHTTIADNHHFLQRFRVILHADGDRGSSEKWMVLDDQYFSFEALSKIYSVKDLLRL